MFEVTFRMVPVMFIARVYGRALCRLVNMVFRPKIALKVPSVIKSNPWGYENNEFLFFKFHCREINSEACG